MSAAKEKKKKSSGATRRRKPFPFRLWGKRFGVAVGIIVGISSLVFGVQRLSSLQITLMPIHEIALIKPLVYQTQEEYVEVISKFEGHSLLLLDLTALREQLEDLPWVQTVTLAKRWPGKVDVGVIEYEPIANWNKDKVLNEQGFPLQKPLASLPLADLNGPDNRSIEVMEHYLLFSDIFSTQGLEIKGVTLQPRGSWSLEMENGLEILLGEQSVLRRSRRVVEFLESQYFQEANIEYVDARYQNGIAIKVKQNQSSEVEHDVAA